MSRCENGKPASARSADAGFTLIEVVVAIVLIGASLLTVVGAVAAAFSYQAGARQTQVATTIATEQMEKLRALPFTVIARGLSQAAVAAEVNGNGNVVQLQQNPPTYGLKYCGGGSGSQLNAAGERIPTSLVTVPNGVLSPHKVDNAWTVDEISYSASSYVSQPSGLDPYHLTVCVTWDWKGKPRNLAIQSWMWAPRGPECVGQPSSLVAGPCSTVSAIVPDGAIALTIDGVQSSFALAGSSAQIRLADSTVVEASYTYATSVGGAFPEDNRVSVTADDDDLSNLATFADTSTPTLLPAIPWVTQPVTNFKVTFLAGDARASTSATSGGSSCTPLAGAAVSAICAASGVSRLAGWLDTRLPLGDDYWIRPAWTTANPFSFASWASISNAGAVGAKVSREFTQIRLMGFPSGRGEFTTFKAAGSLLYSDSLDLTAPAGVTLQDVTAQAAPSNASCDGLALAALPALSGSGTCSLTYSAANKPPSNTYSIAVSYTWTYTAGTSSVAGAAGSPRLITATSPVLEVSATITRNYCGKGGFNNSYNGCQGGGQANAPGTEVHTISIVLDFGTAEASWKVLA